MGVCESSINSEKRISRASSMVESKKQIQKQWSNCSSDIPDVKLESSWDHGSSKEQILSIYNNLGHLGQGYTSMVHKANLKGYSNLLFAIKSIKKTYYTDTSSKYFKEEVSVLKEVDHPNIVRFFECYEDTTNYHLVLELCEGPDLVNLVERTQGLPEDIAKKFFFQAAYAINYLHHAGITHRDIKLDNFLLTSKNVEKADLKLIDFGFAKNFRKNRLASHVGTPWYVAPEVLVKSSSYTSACDNWSLGVMLYIMLFAEAPFKGKNNEEIFQQVISKAVCLDGSKFNHVSTDVKEILRGLLEKTPIKRLSLHHVLQSRWFNPILIRIHIDWGTKEAKKVISKFKKSRTLPKFKQEVIKIMVKIFHENPELKEHQSHFCCCDYLSNGVISPLEIEHLYSVAGIKPGQGEIEQVIDSLYLRTDGVVTYSEFLAGVSCKRFFKDRLRLKATFDRFDIDHSGSITTDNIIGCFGRFGYEISSNSAKMMISDFDPSNSGTISFDEFCNQMRKD